MHVFRTKIRKQNADSLCWTICWTPDLQHHFLGIFCDCQEASWTMAVRSMNRDSNSTLGVSWYAQISSVGWLQGLLVNRLGLAVLCCLGVFVDLGWLHLHAYLPLMSYLSHLSLAYLVQWRSQSIFLCVIQVFFDLIFQWIVLFDFLYLINFWFWVY